jgi:4'-phosphopantetheinyl transferase
MPPLGEGQALCIIARADDILSNLPLERLQLPEAEAARIARYLKADDRDLRRAAHGLARHCLGGLLGRAPAEIHFERDVKGRPFLAMPSDLDFNLSHSGAHVAFAVARGGRIGVDVEAAGTDYDWDFVALGILHPSEQQACAALSASERRQAIRTLWSVKEACLKATGEGLTIAPTKIVPQPVDEGFTLRHGGYDLIIESLVLSDKVQAAIAREAKVSLAIMRLV